MSELDIQLQQQTSDVSITEMMQETEQMKNALRIKGKETEDISTDDYMIDDWNIPANASTNVIREILGEGVPPRLIESALISLERLIND